MKEILLIISLICSLSFTGCSEEQKTDKQVNDLSKQKVEQKVEEPKRETKKKDTESKQEETEQKDNKEEKDLAEDAAERRNFVIDKCINCGNLIHESDNYKDSQYGYVCMDCYDNSYKKCIKCGKTINAYDEGTITGSSGYMCKSCYDKWADESDSYNNDYKEPEEGENAPEYYNCSRCGEKAYYDDGYYPYCSNCANHPEKCPGCGMQMTEINGIYCCLNINCYRYNNPYDNDPDHYDLPSED